MDELSSQSPLTAEKSVRQTNKLNQPKASDEKFLTELKAQIRLSIKNIILSKLITKNGITKVHGPGGNNGFSGYDTLNSSLDYIDLSAKPLEILKQEPNNHYTYHSIQFNPNSSLLVTARGHKIWIWEKVTKKDWKLLSQLSYPTMVSSAVLHADDSSLLTIVSCNRNPVYRLYDPADLEKLINASPQEIRLFIKQSDKNNN